MFHEIAPKTLTENVFSLIGDRWMLITAGTPDHCNTMTASWGGLGHLWGKDVAFAFIRPQRYTKQFVDENDRFSLCFFGGEQIVGLFMTDYNSQIVYAAKEYLFAISLCYSLVSVLFVLRNTLQGLGCTYANAVAGAGELIGRITVSYLFTPLFGFKAVCFAGPVAWLLADLPLIVLYWRKAKQMRKLSNQ